MSAPTIPLQSVEVDGWTCYDGTSSSTPVDSDGNTWIWQEIEGWHGELDVRAAAIDRPMLDGEYDGPTTFAGRVVQISGTLVAPSRYALQRGLDRLSSVLATTVRRAPMTVDEAVHGMRRQAIVRLNGPTMLKRTGPISAEWSISLYSSDPLRYGATEHSITILPFAEGAGRTYDLIHDRVYGSSGATGYGTAYNAGNAPVAPLIVFNGPSTGPSLRVVGGQRVALSGLTILTGERVEIDCAQRTVTYYAGSSVVNRRKFLTSDSRWLTLAPGYTNLFYTTSTGVGSCVVKWRDAWA